MRRPVLLPAALVALLLALGGPAAAQTADPTPPTTDGVAAADAEVARLRAEADALADRYFETLGQLAEVQQRIDLIEARIPELADEAADLRRLTRARAVIAYKRAGHELSSVIDSGGPLEAARRVQWLDRLNARDDALADDLRVIGDRLATQRAELQRARESATAALDDVKQQGQAIDALLADAEARRRVAATPPTTATGDPAPTADPTTDPTEMPTPTVAVTDPAPTTTTTGPKASPPVAPPTYTPTSGTHPHHDDPFLVCTRTRESSGNYKAYNSAGPYLGAYQFLQSTWNSAANHAGRPELVGVPPNAASPYDQDDIAWTLYQWRGSAPWGGTCDPN